MKTNKNHTIYRARNTIYGALCNVVNRQVIAFTVRRAGGTVRRAINENVASRIYIPIHNGTINPS